MSPSHLPYPTDVPNGSYLLPVSPSHPLCPQPAPRVPWLSPTAPTCTGCPPAPTSQPPQLVPCSSLVTSMGLSTLSLPVPPAPAPALSPLLPSGVMSWWGLSPRVCSVSGSSGLLCAHLCPLSPCYTGQVSPTPRVPSRPLQKTLVLVAVALLALGTVALIIGLSLGLKKK